jgi:predicted ABC-type transport system involved in lysophospholipase L1 biosynthesis ATPase subunit
MIEFHEFAGAGFHLGDAVIQAGVEGLILVETAEQSVEVMHCLAGLRAPGHGGIRLFGRDLTKLGRDDRLKALDKVGFVPQDGGLLTALPVWNNILLPRQYRLSRHEDRIAGEFQAAVNFCQEACGPDDAWMRLLPDYVSPYQRRLAAFMRMMLCKPDVCIYENLTGNLPARQKESLLALTRRFHEQQAGRISLYLEFDPGLLANRWPGLLLRATPTAHTPSNANEHADPNSIRISIAPF